MVSQQALTSSLLKNKYLCKLGEEDSKNLLPKAQMSHMSQTKIKSTNSLMKSPSPEAAVLRGRCAEELSASKLLSPLWWWGPQCRHPARHLCWCLCPRTEWGGGQLRQENRLGGGTGQEFHSAISCPAVCYLFLPHSCPTSKSVILCHHSLYRSRKEWELSYQVLWF